MATNKTQATGGKPPKGLCRKKQTNKQQQTKTSACRNLLCLIFGLYDVRYLFLPNTSSGLLFVSTFCEFNIWSIGWFINSDTPCNLRKKREFWNKKSLQKVWIMTSQRLIINNWHLDLHFQINYQINLIIAFVHKRVTPSGVVLLYVRHVQLCAAPKGMDFMPFLV